MERTADILDLAESRSPGRTGREEKREQYSEPFGSGKVVVRRGEHSRRSASGDNFSVEGYRSRTRPIVADASPEERLSDAIRLASRTFRASRRKYIIRRAYVLMTLPVLLLNFAVLGSDYLMASSWFGTQGTPSPTPPPKTATEYPRDSQLDLNVPDRANSSQVSSVATSPNDSSLMIGAFSSAASARAEFVWSHNGGRTWKVSKVPLSIPRSMVSEPQVVFGGVTPYLLFLSRDTLGGPASSVWLATSRDAGVSFGAPLKIADGVSYQPRIAAAGNSVYVGWLSSVQPVGVGTSERASALRVRTSRDRGRTFLPTVEVAEVKADSNWSSSLLSGAGGAVYFLFEGSRPDPFQNRGVLPLSGAGAPAEAAVMLTRSLDGGATFLPPMVLDTGPITGPRRALQAPASASLSISQRTGELYLVSSTSQSGGGVFFRRSEDKGVTWSLPVQVGPAPGVSSGDGFRPHVSVAPNGRVDVLYVGVDGSRDDPATFGAIAHSVDGGRQWAGGGTFEIATSVCQVDESGKATDFMRSAIKATSTPAATILTYQDRGSGDDPDVEDDFVIRYVPVDSAKSNGGLQGEGDVTRLGGSSTSRACPARAR